MNNAGFNKRLFLAAFFILALASFSFAIGVRPSRLVYPFEEGREFSLEYAIINRDTSPIRAGIYLCGPLWKNMRIADNKTVIFTGDACDEAQKNMLKQINDGDLTLEQTGVIVNAKGEYLLSLKVKLPSTVGFQPGISDSRIGFIGLPIQLPPGGAITGGIAAVEGQLWFKVPYPGKYLVLTGEAEDAVLGEKARFKATVTNDGSEPVSDAKVYIDIFDPNGVRKTRLDLAPREVKKGEAAEFPASWDTDGQQLGSYTAYFRLSYADQFRTTEETFRIGGLDVKVSEIDAKPVPKKGIAKIIIGLESRWGDVIRGVYAVISIFDKLGNKVGETTTQSIDLKAFSKENLQAFWETGENGIGEYGINATVFFSDKNRTIEGKVSVVEPGGLGEIKIEYAILAVIIIALGLAFWFFRNRIRIRVK